MTFFPLTPDSENAIELGELILDSQVLANAGVRAKISRDETRFPLRPDVREGFRKILKPESQ